jgi:uncharacterized protein YjiS (DUF1127 family)
MCDIALAHASLAQRSPSEARPHSEARWLERLCASALAAWHEYCLRRARRELARHLHLLDDRMLEDLGFRREQIDVATRAAKARGEWLPPRL